jgi:magnesium transporter
VAEGVAVDIQQIEEQIFSEQRANPAERIYKMEREVLEFHRAVVPLTAPVDRLARGHFDLIDDELRTYFRDVHDHLLRVSQQIQGFRDLLSSALQANLTQVSVRQNEDMRKITAWVAILAVPTAISAIYGMNFTHMPELEWTFGYPLVIGVIAVICTVLYTRFRRAGWL